MYKKTIKYVDYNGEERTEDFYFNFSKAELVELEYGVDGGMRQKIQNIVAAKSQPEIIKMFKDIVLASYGKKSDDGKRFIKSKELREEFSQTEAYSEFFMELATDAKAGADFVNGILPQVEKSSIPAPAVVK